jgi:hypothetical protein
LGYDCCRKRRGQQLKKWAQREREYNLRKKAAAPELEPASRNNRIHFVSAVMLLEAAARYPAVISTI